eukprot:TRINITY_DN3921_c0_g1_i1.p1 TRINITY_DN3921_c0_g1~~TRINITY_DN3921_c0_g1_i1.p1  ORF type:complete len:119 (-),score=28.80 TRINITY_DN3921_c0_g1_i1:65-373(-)
MSVYNKVTETGISNRHKNTNIESDSDDWDTDPDFENDVDEQTQRYGSKTVEGSADAKDALDIHEVRARATEQHRMASEEQYQASLSRYGVSIEEDEKLRGLN